MLCRLIKRCSKEFCVSFLFLPFHGYVVLDLLINVQQLKVFFVVRTEKCIKVYLCLSVLQDRRTQHGRFKISQDQKFIIKGRGLHAIKYHP